MPSQFPPSYQIGEHAYYIHHELEETLNLHLNKILGQRNPDFIPLTVIDWDTPNFSNHDLESVCVQYEAEDDVWSRSFLSIVVLLQTPQARRLEHSQGIYSIDKTKTNLTRGPYVIEKATGQVFSVSRLYPDDHSAFLYGILSSSQSQSFQEIPEANKNGVPVPSRLRSTPSAEKPLAGLRFGVKDVIAIKGLKTGYGNQAWFDTYPVEKFNAPVVQLLLDAGANVVGKLKTTEFTEGLNPGEWDEMQCPFNPRGDGQQNPSSSSTGSAAAAAAYSWLDFTLGSDTGGSIRHPAGVNGVFGNRPSHGVVNLDGVLGSTAVFNTVGVFARDPLLFCKVGIQLLGPIQQRHLKPPTRKYNLLYPTRSPPISNSDQHRGSQDRWFPHSSVDPSNWTEAEVCLETIIQKIEIHLRCQRIPINISELWGSTRPKEQAQSLDEATGHVYSSLTTYFAARTGIDQFIADYAAKNNGVQPFISSLVKRRLDYGRMISTAHISDCLNTMRSFASWTLNLFDSCDQEATTLLIFPQSYGYPDYRDDVADRTELFNDKFSMYAFGYLVGCPDYTIPVAEVPYKSRFTEKIEYLPVSVSLVGSPGTDMELFDVLDILHEKGVVASVKAGKRMYPEH